MPINSPHKRTEDDHCDEQDNPSLLSPFTFIPKIRDDEDNDMKRLNENSNKMVTSMEGLEETMKRIETALVMTFSALEKRQAEVEERVAKKEKVK